MQPLPMLDAGSVSGCRRRVHLEHDPSAANTARAAPDPAVEQRRAAAAAHRRQVAAILAERLGAGWAEVPTELTRAERTDRTSALLQARVPFLWGAQLPADETAGRRGAVDLLVRAGHGYVPVFVVRHKITDPGSGARTGPVGDPRPAAAGHDPDRKPRPQPRDQLALAHSLRMLQVAGLAGPELGGVIGPDAELVLWHDLTRASWPGGRSTLHEYDTRFADRLAVAHAAATGAEPLAEPSRITECRSCPWWPTCGAQLRAARDVSLVVRGRDADALRAAGVQTVDALAAASAVDLPGLDAPVGDAVTLARAWQHDLAVVRRHAQPTVPRADVEVDIDMESFGECGAYLWGCLVSGDAGEAGYHPFATWRPLPAEDEARSFAEFWTWLSGVRARAAAAGRSFAAYCYNEQAENRWMLSSAERFAGRAGVPSMNEVRGFIESPQWIDLYRIVDQGFLCPHGKGLKTVAQVAGFAWQDAEAGGENSMRWYRAAVGLDGAPPDLEQQRRLLTYNADDVHATRALRHWLDSPELARVPLAGELLPLETH